MTVLITGGAGFIGSHVACEVLKTKQEIIIVDNFSNSSFEAIKNLEKISNQKINFVELDLLDKQKLEQVFKNHKITSVIHLAGFKAVGESSKIPLNYYDNNINSTLNLLILMQKYLVFNFVFSSSATVYGVPKTLPITEKAPTFATNPYGRTKLYIENILNDLYFSDPRFNIILLRYFNPVGAHKTYLLGEKPVGVPNNLMPYIVDVALKKRPFVNVFGNNYKTQDGTGIRDYIHVVDLAKGHLLALEKARKKLNEVKIYNLGSGKGYSVLEIIKTFAKENNVEVNYKIASKRKGDIATCFADISLAKKELNWQAKLGLKEMVKDSYNWGKNAC